MLISFCHFQGELFGGRGRGGIKEGKQGEGERRYREGEYYPRRGGKPSATPTWWVMGKGQWTLLISDSRILEVCFFLDSGVWDVQFSVGYLWYLMHRF